jgi:tRNA(fMet)-specific endonuclease VapC
VIDGKCILCISSITRGEILLSLAKMPNPKRLRKVVAEFLRRVDVLSWNDQIMERCESLRADIEKHGIAIEPRDMLIVAHALETNSILVTQEATLGHIKGLTVENWTR